MQKQDTIIIFAAKTARRLIKDGYTIVDIKPDKTDPDKKRSVFIFGLEDGLKEKIQQYKEQN